MSQHSANSIDGERRAGGAAPLSRGARAFIGAQAVLVVCLAAWLVAGKPIGIPGQWTWQIRDKPVPWDGLLRVAVLGLGALGLWWWGVRRIRSRKPSDLPVVMALVALVLVLQWSVASLAPNATATLIAGTASDISTEYFTVAWDTDDPLALCRDYAATMGSGHHHVATHPPGAVLVYWAAIALHRSPFFPGRVFSGVAEIAVGARSALIAQAVNELPGAALVPEAVGAALFCCLLLGLCGALTVLPLYGLVRRASNRRSALAGAALFAVAPAPVLFFQGLDALIMLIAVVGLALTQRAMARRSVALAVAAGVVLASACFISFGALAATILAAAVAAMVLVQEREPRRCMIGPVVAGCIAWAATIVAQHLLCGGELPTIFRQAMAAHRQFTWITSGRTYHAWLGMDVVEFACFLGLPCCVALARAGWVSAVRGWRGLRRADLVGWSALGVLALLVVSGSVRGEVGRIWLFMMPALLGWAGSSLSGGDARRQGLLVSTLLLALAQLLVMGWRLTPVVTPY